MARTPKAPRERVALRHPSGKFTVLVSPSRAAALAARGYQPLEPAPAPDRPQGVDRKALMARAKALGIEGYQRMKNADLSEAVAAALAES